MIQVKIYLKPKPILIEKVKGEMALWRLRITMLGTLAVLIGISTLFFTAILAVLGVFNLFSLLAFVLLFNIAQWLFSPYLIDRLYHVRKLEENEQPWLHQALAKICERSGTGIPRLMLAQINLPNAFAYGSPIAGNRMAITSGLLQELNQQEVGAVIGHEVGHLKHRDVQIMMIASLLPALFYYLGYSFIWSGGGSRGRNNGATSVLIGIGSIVVYWVLTFVVLGLGRLREYYADAHSAQILEGGATNLSTGLAKIVSSTSRKKLFSRQPSGGQGFKALFIADPDTSVRDAAEMASAGVEFHGRNVAMVEELLNRPVSTGDRILELFSTHPNIAKRLRALKELQS